MKDGVDKNPLRRVFLLSIKKIPGGGGDLLGGGVAMNGNSGTGEEVPNRYVVRTDPGKECPRFSSSIVSDRFPTRRLFAVPFSGTFFF